VTAKRIFDLTFTIPGIVLLMPLFVVLAVWIKLDSPGPVFFRQVRVGQYGKEFLIYKFRTMVVDAEKLGRQITVGDDVRITRSGRFLRKYKLDELPQLFNVLKGEMSLVGPRPEVPRYVAEYPERIRKIVLSVPPGITDFASIIYKDENRILASAKDYDTLNPEQVYIKKILPIKLAYYEYYVNKRTIWLDFKLVFVTFKSLFDK